MNRAISLIELITVIAIISALAVAVVPTYQKQLVRSRISDLMPLAEGQQIKIVADHNRGVKYGTSTETIIASGETNKPRYLGSLVRGEYGCIYLNLDLTQLGLDAAGGEILSLAYCPSIGSAGSNVLWNCGYTATSTPDYRKYLPLNCQLEVVVDSNF